MEKLSSFCVLLFALPIPFTATCPSDVCGSSLHWSWRPPSQVLAKCQAKLDPGRIAKTTLVCLHFKMTSFDDLSSTVWKPETPMFLLTTPPCWRCLFGTLILWCLNKHFTCAASRWKAGQHWSQVSLRPAGWWVVGGGGGSCLIIVRDSSISVPARFSKDSSQSALLVTLCGFFFNTYLMKYALWFTWRVKEKKTD